MPYLRGIVAELGFQRQEIKYTQQKRSQGKSHFNFMTLYDVAMLGITSYSKVIMRLATFLGVGIGIASIIVAIITFIRKLIDWDSFPIGSAAISVGVFFLGGIQLFFIGLLGEYILSINTRVMHRPLVVEERRINFDNKKDEKEDDVGAKTKEKMSDSDPICGIPFDSDSIPENETLTN